MAKKQKMKKGRKATNEHQKKKYAERRMFITERNRKQKQLKHLKRNPNDTQLINSMQK